MIPRGTPFDKFSTLDQASFRQKPKRDRIDNAKRQVREREKNHRGPGRGQPAEEGAGAGIELYPGIHRHFLGNCHGFGQCASCCVKVKKGKENLSPQTFYERLRMILGMFTSAARKGHEDELRLACRTRVLGDVEIETKPDIMNLYGERFWG